MISASDPELLLQEDLLPIRRDGYTVSIATHVPVTPDLVEEVRVRDSTGDAFGHISGNLGHFWRDLPEMWRDPAPGLWWPSRLPS